MENISLKDNYSGKKYIAFFDLDHTIINANSGKLLIQYAYKTGVISRRFVVWGMYLSMLYKFGLKDPVRIIRSITGWLKGVTEQELHNLSNEMFKTHLVNHIRPEIEKKIHYHKMNDALIVILSSSIFPVCKVIADHLKVDEIICSTLKTSDGLYTGDPEGLFCFGNEKVKRLMEHCQNKNINPALCWYYGDSVDDLPVLRIIGNPVCVNPDKKLLKEAKQKGWEIMTCQ
jgi:HAD superfamily hydrolase (TIGR01490 family)